MRDISEIAAAFLELIRSAALDILTSRAAERPDEECCQGRAEVREGERHQQGEAGATQAKEAALIRRGRRCHERGEVACYVPDIMSCPRHDVAPNYTKLHRRLMCVRPYGEVACPRKATARVRVTLTIQTIKHSEHFGQELISWNTLPR